MGRSHRVRWAARTDGRGCWRFTKVVDGRRRTFNSRGLGPDDREAAEAWMRSVLAGMGEARGPDGPTVAELRDAWLLWADGEAKADRISPQSVKGWRSESRQVANAIGGMRAAELTVEVGERLASAWSNLSVASIRNRLATLKAMTAWAARRGLIPADPLAGLRRPKAAYRGERYARAEEVGAFLEWVDRRHERLKPRMARFQRMTAVLIRLVAETGCRPGEICAARWEHYDPDLGAIVLPPTLHKTGRKTGRLRTIVLSREMAARIEAIRSDPWVHPTHIFAHRVGTRGPRPKGLDERMRGVPWKVTALARHVRELRREAIRDGVGVKDVGLGRMHLYRLRHSSITSKVMQGMSLADVAALHGNSVREIERTYCHVQISHLRGVIDRLG